MTEIQYQKGMSLGLGFDRLNDEFGYQLFEEDFHKRATETSVGDTRVKVELLEKLEDLTTKLGISAQVVLSNILSPIANVENKFSFMSSSKSTSSTRTLFMAVHVEKFYESLPGDWNEHFKETNESTRFSHFIHTITYGGDLVIRFVIAFQSENDAISVDEELKVSGAAFDISSAMHFLQNHSKKTKSVSIDYYSSISKKIAVLETFDEAKEMVKDFEGQLDKKRYEKVPILCTILPVPPKTGQEGLPVDWNSCLEVYADLERADSKFEDYVKEMTDSLAHEDDKKQKDLGVLIVEARTDLRKKVYAALTDNETLDVADIWKKSKTGRFERDVESFFRPLLGSKMPYCRQLTSEMFPIKISGKLISDEGFSVNLCTDVKQLFNTIPLHIAFRSNGSAIMNSRSKGHWGHQKDFGSSLEANGQFLIEMSLTGSQLEVKINGKPKNFVYDRRTLQWLLIWSSSSASKIHVDIRSD